MVHVVSESVANLTLRPEDQAVVLLALRLALAIDQAEDTERALYRHGSRLLAVLTALGATPSTRTKQAAPAPAAGALAVLRQQN